MDTCVICGIMGLNYGEIGVIWGKMGVKWCEMGIFCGETGVICGEIGINMWSVAVQATPIGPPSKRPKVVRDPNQPKQNKTPFNFYSIEARERAKATFPNYSQKVQRIFPCFGKFRKIYTFPNYSQKCSEPDVLNLQPKGSVEFPF
jgi:hypothetical protein